MATTYTAKLRFRKMATADRAWDVGLNTNADILDAITPLSALTVITAEIPSASLNVAIAPGKFRANNGATVSYAGVSTLAMGASTTTKIWLNNAGTIVTGAAYPATPFLPLATVTSGASTITGIVDDRQPYMMLANGPTTGTATLAAGTVTVSATQTTAASVIWFVLVTAGGTVGFPRVSTQTAGASFVITSTSGSDTSTYRWFLMEP